MKLLGRIRLATDVLRNRMPGALAMLKAEDISISSHHKGGESSCRIDFHFGTDFRACHDAYRAYARIYDARAREPIL